MATVTTELPDFITPGTNAERIRWQDQDNGLADVVSLSIGQGTTVVLTRFQINGDQDRVQIQTVNSLPGTGSGSGPSLSDAWERNLDAVRLEAAGLTNLTIGGPLVTGNPLTDTTEPYVWEPGDNITYIANQGLSLWVDAFKSAYALDTTLRATLVLSDQAAVVVVPEALAGLVTAGSPTVSGNLTAIAPTVPEALAGLVTAGAPVVSGELTAIAPSVPEALAGLVTAGTPTVAGNLTAIAPAVVVPEALAGLVTAGSPTVTGNLQAIAPITAAAPDQVSMVTVEDETADTALARWDVPDSEDPITRYDYSLDGGAWTDTGSTSNAARIAGLDAGRSYQVRIRAASINGNGAASVGVSFSTVSAGAPSVPRFVVATAPGGRHVDLAWLAPTSDGGADIIGYQVCVIDEAGVASPFENTDDAATAWRVRGLAFWHRYGFRVRAVNASGAGAQTPVVYVVPRPAMPRMTEVAGQRIPLLDEDRQSIIVTIGERDCRISVWWQPSDQAWYGSLEVPTNTPVVSGRRLALNSGLLDRIGAILPGNVVLRELGDTGAEPARDAWRRPTHALMWEAA